jgi:hypothetical protein
MFEELESAKLPFDQFLPPERSPFSPSGEKGQHGAVQLVLILLFKVQT